MTIDFRRLAVATAGFCTFLHLYGPQALLPELARDFGVGAAQISAMITASTLAIALTAPFTGAAADVLGRKRLITAAMFAVALPVFLDKTYHLFGGVMESKLVIAGVIVAIFAARQMMRKG